MIFVASNSRRIRVGLLSAGAVFVGAAMTSVQAMAQTTQMVSVDSDGVQGNAGSTADRLSVSADGRYVAFSSEATNLVPGDTNGTHDVFVHDRQTGTTERVSISSNGEQGNNFSVEPSMSADGRYVAFASVASNLVAGDTNSVTDVFVHDRQTGSTERVSVTSAGGQTVNGNSGYPAISGDGRYVAFSSGANNLVANDTNQAGDVFVRDLQTGAIQRVSISVFGSQGDRNSDFPSISHDGRYVAFMSQATYLVPSHSNGDWHVYVYDRQTATPERVSVSSNGSLGNAASQFPSISGDGRYVAFTSSADNLVANDTNSATDVFVRDRVAGVTKRVSVSSTGAQGNPLTVIPTMSSYLPRISSNGFVVAFTSYANNLVPGDDNDTADVFVHDQFTGNTDAVSVSADGALGDLGSYGAGLNANGRYAAFGSYATNLVPGGANGLTQIFARDRGPIVKLANISTRARVQTGDNVMIGGFIVGGDAPKTVLIRARGGSLGGAPFNNPGVLADPTMQLYSGQTVIAQNNDWQTTDPLCLSPATGCGGASEISGTGVDPCQANPGQSVAPPGCTQESALYVTLQPATYTIIVRGVGGSVGMGLVEVFEVGTSPSTLINISTRARVETGDNVMIGGFIVEGSTPETVLIRARGGSLGGAPFNNPGVLANPTMQLYSGQTVIAQNNDWFTTDPLCVSPATACGGMSEILATGLGPCQPNPGQSSAPPGCAQESALYVTLLPGTYTVIVRGVGGTSGMGLFEVFEVP